MAQVGEQIDHAGFREAFNRHRAAEAFEWSSGCRVQRGQEEAGRDDIDDIAAVEVGIAHALAVVGAHGIGPAPSVGLAVGPQGGAGCRVDGDHVAARAGDRVQAAVDVTRRRAAALRLETGAVPGPGDFQIAEVLRRDLVGRSRTGVGEVIAQGGPLDGVLAPGYAGQQQQAGSAGNQSIRFHFAYLCLWGTTDMCRSHENCVTPGNCRD